MGLTRIILLNVLPYYVGSRQDTYKWIINELSLAGIIWENLVKFLVPCLVLVMSRQPYCSPIMPLCWRKYCSCRKHSFGSRGGGFHNVMSLFELLHRLPHDYWGFQGLLLGFTASFYLFINPLPSTHGKNILFKILGGEKCAALMRIVYQGCL